MNSFVLIYAFVVILPAITGQAVFAPSPSALPTTTPPVSTLPNISVAGILNIVLSVSITGQYSDRGAAVVQSLSLWQTIANDRGGVKINGTQYYFAYTLIDDASSLGYVFDIYTRFAASTSPSYDIFFGPAGSTNTATAVNTVKPYANGRPFMAQSAVVDTIFTSGYQDVYDQEGVTSERLNKALIMFDALQPALTSAAVFVRYDKTANTTMSVLIPWLQSRNITIKQTAYSFPADATSVGIGNFYALLNQTFFGQPSPDLLVLVASGETDFFAMVPAFNQFQLTPKLCFCSTQYADTPYTTFEEEASGWITTAYWDVSKQLTSTLPGTLFDSSQDYYNQFDEMFGAKPNLYNMQMSNALELMMAALNVESNISTAAYRAAMRSLNGSTIACDFALHPIYQYNVRAIYYVYQLRDGVNVYIPTVKDLDYPVAWPWIVVQPGDDIPYTQSINMIPLATLLAVAGSWVALILVEQVILFRKQQSPLLYAWLCMMTVSLGIAGAWTSIIVQYSALSIKCESCMTDMSISFSLGMMLLAFLPTIVFIFIGLFIIATAISNPRQVKPHVDINEKNAEGSLLPYHRSSINSCTTSNTSSLLNKEKKKPITIELLYFDMIALVEMVYNRLSLRLLVGTGFISLSFVLCRQLLIYALIANAQFTVTTWSAVISACIVWILITPAMSIYFYGAFYRLLGVALVTAALLIDYQFQFQTMSVTYQPNRIDETLSAYPTLRNIQIESSIVLLIAGIIGAVSGVSFIGLQFNKMQISHHSLATALSRQKTKLNDAEKDRRLQTKQKEVLAAVNNELNRLLNASSMRRPCSFVVDKPLISYELVWALNSSVPQSSLQASATLCHAESCTPRTSTDRNALDVPSGLNSLTHHSLPFHPNVSATVADGETSALNQLRFQSAQTSDTALEHITLYQPSLNAILSHPLTFEIFKDEVECSHCVENVLFLAQMDRFRSVSNKELRKEVARRIYEEFIADGSPQQLNIDSTLRQSVEDHIVSSYDVNSLFERCAKEVRSLLMTNQWKSFVTRPAYIQCALILLRNVDVSRAIRHLEVEAEMIEKNAQHHEKLKAEKNDVEMEELSIFEALPRLIPHSMDNTTVQSINESQQTQLSIK